MRGSIILTILLALGILLGGIVSVLRAEAAPTPDRAFETAPPLRLDSLFLRAQEAALDLFRQGCLEAKVALLPDQDGGIEVYATCIEWEEVRPASQ